MLFSARWPPEAQIELQQHGVLRQGRRDGVDLEIPHPAGAEGHAFELPGQEGGEDLQHTPSPLPFSHARQNMSFGAKKCQTRSPCLPSFLNGMGCGSEAEI